MDETKVEAHISIPLKKEMTFFQVYEIINELVVEYFEDNIVPFTYIVQEDTELHGEGEMLIPATEDIKDYIEKISIHTSMRLFSQKNKMMFVCNCREVHGPVTFVAIFSKQDSEELGKLIDSFIEKTGGVQRYG